MNLACKFKFEIIFKLISQFSTVLSLNTYVFYFMILGYTCVVNDNPWWAVYQHTCPKCNNKQVPRLDISLISNAIESDPNVIALYGESNETDGTNHPNNTAGTGNELDDELEHEIDEYDTDEDSLDMDEFQDDDKPFDGKFIEFQCLL